MERNEPGRPDVTNYAGRHARDGSMHSEQRAAHNYNLKLNQNWYAHQRNVNAGPGPERHQPPPEKSLHPPRESRRADLHPAPARAPEKAAPEPRQARIELRHGFNKTVEPSKPENQVRRDYSRQPSAVEKRFGKTARETLRHEAEPVRSLELNRPAPDRARGLER
jgi:hypothetical protein